MGCCVSTPKSSIKPQSPNSPLKEDRSLVPESDPPESPDTNQFKTHLPPPPAPLPVAPLLPPPLLEEETVKEVLSETPTPKPNTSHHQVQKQRILRLPSFPKIEEEEEEMKKKKKKVSLSSSPIEEISEATSEICSLSEASVSTSVLTELSREDFELHHRFDNRSPSKTPKKRPVSGEFVSSGGKSPARRKEPSLGIRGESVVKSVSDRDVGQTARRRVLVQNESRRDLGESSGRRSKSPAATRKDISAGVSRNGVGKRSPSKRIVGSPGRMPARENRWWIEEGKGKEEKWQTKESLEDPLVSLECFIFL